MNPESKTFSFENDVPYQALNTAHEADQLKAQGGEISEEVKQTTTEEQLYPTTQVQADNLAAYQNEADNVNGRLQNAFDLESRMQGNVRPDGQLESSEFDVRTGGNPEVETQLRSEIETTVNDFLITTEGDEKALEQGLPNIANAIAKGLEMGSIDKARSNELKDKISSSIGGKVADNVESGYFGTAGKWVRDAENAGLLTPEGKADLQVRAGEIVGGKVADNVESGYFGTAGKWVRDAENAGLLTPEKSQELLQLIEDRKNR